MIYLLMFSLYVCYCPHSKLAIIPKQLALKKKVMTVGKLRVQFVLFDGGGIGYSANIDIV